MQNRLGPFDSFFGRFAFILEHIADRLEELCHRDQQLVGRGPGRPDAFEPTGGCLMPSVAQPLVLSTVRWRGRRPANQSLA